MCHETLMVFLPFLGFLCVAAMVMFCCSLPNSPKMTQRLFHVAVTIVVLGFFSIPVMIFWVMR